MQDIGVLVVDDSALMRNLISRIIENGPGMHVVGTAMNGSFALEKIPTLKPDVIILDIEMPIMNGIQFLEERKNRGLDIPVIILSSIAKEGAAITMKCLELGASDFITKPSGSVSNDIAKVADRVIELVSSYGAQYLRKKGLHLSGVPTHTLIQRAEEVLAQKTPQKFTPIVPEEKGVVPLRAPGKIEIIAIGISTGGPNALREVFAHLSEAITQPILVVQHMPVGFTAEFANSLNAICPLEVKEAQDGDLLKKGRVLIAPGNQHIIVERKALASVVRLSDNETRNGHRPSVDVLFESVAKEYQNRALGVIMTGMGRDGAAQLAEMRRQGAHTLGQDEESSVVYGMPRVAFELGAVQKQVSLEQMANEINNLALSNQ